MIHLDTSFLVSSLVAGSSAQARVRNWLAVGEVLQISSITWAEFLCGPLNAQDEAYARQLFPQPEAFLSVDAAKAAALFNLTGRRSRSLADCMIAAVAIRCGIRLATINLADFQTFVAHGLVLA